MILEHLLYGKWWVKESVPAVAASSHRYFDDELCWLTVRRANHVEFWQTCAFLISFKSSCFMNGFSADRGSWFLLTTCFHSHADSATHLHISHSDSGDAYRGDTLQLGHCSWNRAVFIIRKEWAHVTPISIIEVAMFWLWPHRGKRHKNKEKKNQTHKNTIRHFENALSATFSFSLDIVFFPVKSDKWGGSVHGKMLHSTACLSLTVKPWLPGICKFV